MFTRFFDLENPTKGTDMFERFTDRARRVVVLAQDEAKLLDHNYISIEHLLLGLIAEADGIAGKSLTDMGITLESTRERVEQAVGRGDGALSGQHIPFTRDAKKVLELALREALVLGHSYIGTEHQLLGLLRLDADHVTLGESEVMMFDVDTEALRLRIFGRLRATDRTLSRGERRESAQIRHDLHVAMTSVDILKAELAEAVAWEGPED